MLFGRHPDCVCQVSDVPGSTDPRLFMAGLECLTLVDYSLFIKAGAHYLLCGGTICKLGTKVRSPPRH